MYKDAAIVLLLVVIMTLLVWRRGVSKLETPTVRPSRTPTRTWNAANSSWVNTCPDGFPELYEGMCYGPCPAGSFTGNETDTCVGGQNTAGAEATKTTAPPPALDWVSRGGKMGVPAVPSSVPNAPPPPPASVPSSRQPPPPPPASVSATVGRPVGPGPHQGDFACPSGQYISGYTCYRTGTNPPADMGRAQRQLACISTAFPTLVDGRCYGSCPSGYRVSPTDAKSCTRA